MTKIKSIIICPASVSVYMKGQKTLKQMILDDWDSLTAQEIKKFYPEIEVECWAPEKIMKKPQEFNEFGIRYRQFPTTFSPQYGLDLSIPMLKEIKKEIKKAKSQNYKVVFHIHEYHQLHGLIIAALFKNANIIGQHHGGSWPLKHLRENKSYKKIFPLFIFGQILENLFLKNIKIFYPLSQTEINYLEKVAPNSKIRFQTMGIDDYYFESLDKNKARKKLNWPKDKKIVLFLGRLIPSKGIEYLLKAAEDLKDIQIKIIGWGEQEKYEKYAKDKKLDNVEFLGSIFGKNKLSYLSAADAFILPSCKEGASVSVMEAMARNLPIVTTDTGGMPLMINNEKEGIVIKQRSPEEIVRGIREILKWKKKNIKQYAERYKWKKIVEDTVKDYQSFI
jgi:glycosyltransferase involved in cell wall biosynthesis